MTQYRYELASPHHIDRLNAILAEGWVPVREVPLASMTAPVDTHAAKTQTLHHTGEMTGWSTAYALILFQRDGN